MSDKKTTEVEKTETKNSEAEEAKKKAKAKKVEAKKKERSKKNIAKVKAKAEKATARARAKTDKAEKAEAKKSEAKKSKANGRIPDDAVITLLKKGNQRTKLSAAHQRFALYRDGQTVAQYLAKGKKAGLKTKKSNVAVDLERGNISLS